jgi:hypothetical protein
MAAQTNAPFGFQFCGMDNGLPTPPQIEVPITSNVSLYAGDPIRLSGGYGVLCTTSQTPYAVLTEDVTAVTNTRVNALAIPVLASISWRAQSTTTAACSRSTIGGDYGMNSTSGGMGLSLAVTTGPWNIAEIDPRSAAGTYTIFIVKANKSAYTGMS